MSVDNADLALRSAQARLAGIVEIAADAIISLDGDQRITYFNQGAELTFGWKREEVLGQPLDILIPEHLRANHRRHVAEFGAGQSRSRRMGHRMPISGLRRSGEVFPAEASISKHSLDGETQYHVVLRDVTEQRQAEAQQRFLAEAGEILTGTLDLAETYERAARAAVPRLADACVIWILSDDGTELQAVAAHGRASLPGAGSLLERMKGASIPMTSSHAAAHVARTHSRAAFRVGDAESATGELDVASLMHAAATGPASPALGQPGAEEVHGLLVSISAAGDTEGVLGLYRATRAFAPESVVIAEDFARRLALASDNGRLYERARRAIRARDDTIAVVSHDLRNPVNAIRMIAGALLDRSEHEEVPLSAVREELATIASGARQADALIQDLLDVARIEAGTLQVLRAPLDISTLLVESAELLRPLARERGLSLVVDVPAELPALEADGQRMQQVISNLVGNALKFTPRGGRVTLRAAAEGERVLIRVEDTGSGIPPDELPHVFERHWQANPRGRHGAGLGLPIARGIVHAHGGRLTVESEVGVGSAFVVELKGEEREKRDW